VGHGSTFRRLSMASGSWSFCFRFAPMIGVSWFGTAAFGFFLTMTPLSNFLASFFGAAETGLVGGTDGGLLKLDKGGGLFEALVRAATALLTL